MLGRIAEESNIPDVEQKLAAHGVIIGTKLHLMLHLTVVRLTWDLGVRANLHGKVTLEIGQRWLGNR